VTRRVVAGVWTLGFEEGANADAAAFVRRPEPDRGADVAVADGASSTLFAGDWSRRLVDAAVQGWGTLTLSDLSARIDALRGGFEPLAERAVMNASVEEAWLIEGSAATLLAATLTSEDGGFSMARVTAVGDSVLMVLQGDSVLTLPPLTSSQFTSTPRLVSSFAGERVDAQRWELELDRDAVVLLATDAVAAHLIRVVETDGSGALRESLGELVDSARRHGVRGTDLPGVLLRGTGRSSFQDDATLVVCADVPDRGGSDLELLASAVTGIPETPHPGVLEWLRRLVTGSRAR
jgi:hypothetical protein